MARVYSYELDGLNGERISIRSPRPIDWAEYPYIGDITEAAITDPDKESEGFNTLDPSANLFSNSGGFRP